MDSGKEILYLFDRPTEPVFVPKGEKKVAFDIPASYLVKIINSNHFWLLNIKQNFSSLLITFYSLIDTNNPQFKCLIALTMTLKHGYP